MWANVHEIEGSQKGNGAAAIHKSSSWYLSNCQSAQTKTNFRQIFCRDLKENSQNMITYLDDIYKAI